jgi:Flp pilus assembly protein TadD
VQDHLHHAREFAVRHITWIHDRAQVDAILRLTRDAESALASGALDDAARAARRALALNPYHAPALLCLARTEWRAGHGDEARTLIAQAMAVADHDPAIAAAWAEMGANASL